jgi:hypothetical protein
MAPRSNQDHVLARARFETALADLCRAARSRGIEARELAGSLLRAGAHYARITGWPLTTLRRKFGVIWREDEEQARTAGMLPR